MVILTDLCVAGFSAFFLFFGHMNWLGIVLVLGFDYWYYFKHELRPSQMYGDGMPKKFFKRWDELFQSDNGKSKVI